MTMIYSSSIVEVKKDSKRKKGREASTKPSSDLLLFYGTSRSRARVDVSVYTYRANGAGDKDLTRTTAERNLWVRIVIIRHNVWNAHDVGEGVYTYVGADKDLTRTEPLPSIVIIIFQDVSYCVSYSSYSNSIFPNVPWIHWLR